MFQHHARADGAVFHQGFQAFGNDAFVPQPQGVAAHGIGCELVGLLHLPHPFAQVFEQGGGGFIGKIGHFGFVGQGGNFAC